MAEATVKMEEVPAADGDQWRVAEDGRLQLQLSGKEGEMEVVLGWQRRAYKLEVRWSKRSKVHAGWCREGAASGPPLSPLATPERKARGRPRKKQGVEGVQLDDGGLGALVRKLGFGEEVVFGGGKKMEGEGDERKEQDKEEQEKEMSRIGGRVVGHACGVDVSSAGGLCLEPGVSNSHLCSIGTSGEEKEEE